MPPPIAYLPHMEELDRQALRQQTRCGEGTMVWRTWGTGEPILLLHGAHGSWLHWHHNIPELSRHYRLIVPDLPGFGSSDVVLPLESPQAHAQTVADGLREILGDDVSVSVVGFSAGAFLGCHLDVIAPGLVSRLIMVDAGGLGTPMRVVPFESMRGLDAAQRWEANRRNLDAFMYHDGTLIDDGAIIMSAMEAPRMRSHFPYFIVPDHLLAIARQVRAPIDLAWGEFDYPHPDPEGNLAAVREFQPDAHLRVVHGAGHWSMGEQPARFNRALLELLQLPQRPRLG